MSDKPKFARLGPTSIDDCQLSKFNITHDELYKVWNIIGNSASNNLNHFPVWKAICMAYLEGLHHGAGIERERTI